MAIGDRLRAVGETLRPWVPYLVILTTPIVLTPLPVLSATPESRCGYVVFIMAVYWLTDVLPIAVTALIPVFAFPLLDIMTSEQVAVSYFNDVMMLFIGGLIVAVAVEYWNLHKRIALKILLLVGVEPRRLMLGIMLPTWFLSMWISNTATTAMMMPIMEAILVQLQETGGLFGGGPNNTKRNKMASSVKCKTEQESCSCKTSIEEGLCSCFLKETKKDDFLRMCKGLSLSVCYAANCGGMASLTGTAPNLILKKTIDEAYEDIGRPSPVTFGNWMALGLPVSAAVLFTSWCWLNVAFLRCQGLCNQCHGQVSDKDQVQMVRQVIQREYDKLGPLVFAQVMVLIFFGLLVVCWVTRDMGGVVGWGYLFGVSIKDGTPAMLVACLLFATPSSLPFRKSTPKRHGPDTVMGVSVGMDTTQSDEENFGSGAGGVQPLLQWDVVRRRFPWKVIFLLGGGFAISAGSEASGLSQWVAVQLEFFNNWNKWSVLFVFCYLTAGLTEVTSNTAIATIVMPIMIQLARTTDVHPLYYMLPTAIAASFAFMLPVATPPNAIVFTYGRVTIPDMMKSGIALNLLSVPILIGLTGSIGDAIFDFQDIPGELLNSTATELIPIIK